MNIPLLVMLAIGLLQHSGPARQHAPIEKLLAGYTTAKSERIAIRDTKTGYYLVRTGD